MTTITKEWLQQTIAEFENTRDDIPFGLSDDDAKILIVLKRALASLEAEPVAYNQVQRCMMKDIIVRKLGGNLLGDKLMMADIHAVTMALIQAGFRTAPPAPVVPDDWVMVPKEPTQAMIKAWLSEVADWRGHVAGYKAALAAAPKPQNVPQNIPENIPAGKSTLTPDGLISCNERMPEKGQNVLISVNFDSSLVEQLICSARYTGSTFRRGDATIKPGNGIEQATHWMPLPEPPQEAK